MKRKFHDIRKIEFINDQMMIIIDGKEHKFKLKDISKPLLQATMKERERYRILASGYGIHWPLIDEDLSIDGLLGIKHQPIKKSRKIAV